MARGLGIGSVPELRAEPPPFIEEAEARTIVSEERSRAPRGKAICVVGGVSSSETCGFDGADDSSSNLGEESNSGCGGGLMSAVMLLR